MIAIFFIIIISWNGFIDFFSYEMYLSYWKINVSKLHSVSVFSCCLLYKMIELEHLSSVSLFLDVYLFQFCQTAKKFLGSHSASSRHLWQQTCLYLFPFCFGCGVLQLLQTSKKKLSKYFDFSLVLSRKVFT